MAEHFVVVVRLFFIIVFARAPQPKERGTSSILFKIPVQNEKT